MNVATIRLTGIVSERPADVDPVYRELREVLAENDRLILRNKTLKRQLVAALNRVAELEANTRGALLLIEPEQPALTLGRLRLNYELRQLELDGRTVHLTQRGVALIGYLMGRPDRVAQARKLADVLDLPPDGNAVRTLIWRTRHQLAEIGALPYLRTYGRTWSGGGYWMTDAGGPS